MITVAQYIAKFLKEKEYHIHQAIVFSNEQKVYQEQGILYMPIYYAMFLRQYPSNDVILPELEYPA